MRIVRYEDELGFTGSAALNDDGVAYRISGDIFGEFEVTADVVEVRKRLAPVNPKQIIGIGLNYRYHAAESNLPVPQYPVVFMKSLNAVQKPGRSDCDSDEACQRRGRL